MGKLQQQIIKITLLTMEKLQQQIIKITLLTMGKRQQQILMHVHIYIDYHISSCWSLITIAHWQNWIVGHAVSMVDIC